MAIKVFTSAQTGAPTLQGQNGSLISLLDAVLVNGYNTVSVTSITRTGSTATVTTAANHNMMSGESVLISGAVETDYNVEAVIAVTDATHFTYTVANAPSTPATGTITMKRAPAGFDKVFSSTNKAVYRSKDTSGTRPYLQVTDDGTTTGAAREAKLRGYLTMTDINTGSEPFPTATQKSEGLYAYKSQTVDTVSRPWALITDGKTFYFQACMDRAPTSMLPTDGYLWWTAFGDIISTRAGDPYSAFLAASNTANQQVSGGYGTNHNGLFVPTVRTANPTSDSCFTVRSFTQVTGAEIMNPMGHGWDQYAIGTTTIVGYPHLPDNGFIMTPLMGMQRGVFRGRFPGVFEPLHGRVLNQFDVIENVDGYPGRKFMAMWGACAYTNMVTGMLMFDITGDSNGKWS